MVSALVIVYFILQVLQFDGTLAGVVLLVGQLADGISTPIVGILSDRENKIPMCAKYGRRKVWHLIGETSQLYTVMKSNKLVYKS